ncbi:MAG TPA: Gfo/Idh/MocA family oxidoreductase [Gemmatimonadaceae bacterium]|nr:Gfo/Idh/MocA family oxidoreductase [Gemmatimonadaceae bacterium]
MMGAGTITRGVPARTRPRLGFLGVGWIGRHRMGAIAESGVAEIAAMADASEAALESAREHAPDCGVTGSFEELLDAELDGIVIATPSAMHAAQAIEALEHGVAVFCQKPLARTAAETQRVIEAARAANRLLGVDLSYRFTEAMQRIRQLVQGGELGSIFAVDLVFHNAYGPDKPWFFDPRLSGGGCVIDLGIHLVDLALWTLGFPRVTRATSRLFSRGEPLRDALTQVEDFAEARMDLEGGAAVRLACSWNLPAGRDAVIEASFYGTGGGAAMRNVNGSFFDFRAERFRGTARETLSEPPDAWGGRAAVEWARQLERDNRFDPAVEHLVNVAAALDAIYGR